MKVELDPSEWASVIACVVAMRRLAAAYEAANVTPPRERFSIGELLVGGQRLTGIARSIAEQCGENIEHLIAGDVGAAND